MLAFLSGGKTLLVLLAGVAIIAVVTGFWIDYRHMQDALAAAQARAAVEDQVNAANVAQLAQVKADADRAIAGLEADRAAALTRAAEQAAIAKEISHAKPGDDGATAPVVRNTIAKLYKPRAARSQNSGSPAESTKRSP